MTQDQDAKELTLERWRLSERRCYFLLSSSGATIGYALVTVRFDGSIQMASYFSLVLVFWVFSFLAGIRCLGAIQNEIEELHRNLETPAIKKPSGTNKSALAPNWAKERDRIYGQVRSLEFFQLHALMVGGALFAIERLGWFEILKMEFAIK
ncbi:hypothetical protein [Roseobacter sp. A03A-229]